MNRGKPLAGIRVLDLTQVLSGPYCTRLMADAGATVVKVEAPHGDPSRGLPVPLADGHSGYYAWLNCGKRSITMNLRSEEGAAYIRELAASADVLVENMRPGKMASLGLEYDVLAADNPALVMCSISCFGPDGPYASHAGHGIIAEAWGGVIDMTGSPDGPPMPVGVALADISTGIHAYGAIMTALLARGRHGCGDHIDLALIDSVLPFYDVALESVLYADADPTRSGRDSAGIVPYGAYDGADGSIVVAIGTDALWNRFEAELFGGTDGPEYSVATNQQRMEHAGYVREMIERWIDRKGSIERALATLTGLGVPCAPIKSVRDVPDAEPFLARRSFVDVPHGEMGTFRVLNTPYRLRSQPLGPSGAAPRLGADTALLLEIDGGGDAFWAAAAPDRP